MKSGFIDGDFVDGLGETYTFRNPADDQTIYSYRECTPDDVNRAVNIAHERFLSWSSLTPSERSRLILRWADLIENDVAELTELEVRETGKPIAVFRDGELPFAVDNLRYFAGAARSLEGTGAGILSQGYTSLLTRRPLGVIASIAPWNFPLVMAVWKFGPALAVGNTVVLKPAPQTPSTSLRLAQLAIEAGIPAGVFNVITGSDHVGESLVAHPQVSMVSVTGATSTGRAIMSSASDLTKRVHLELGGKAPVIVFADADLDAMAQSIAMAATYNSGQDCTAATRIYAQETVFDSVCDRVATKLQQIRFGDPFGDATDIGPLISVEHRNHVHGFVERAVAGGAKVLCGGALPEMPGSFYPPTLIIEAKQDSEIVQNEVFGPVLVALPFEDESQAITLANDSRFGLASSVWTSDVSCALRVAHQIEAGVTWINDHLPIASEAPHGGVKESGFGKDMSQESLLEYTVTRHIMVKHDKPIVHDSFRPA